MRKQNRGQDITEKRFSLVQDWLNIWSHLAL